MASHVNLFAYNLFFLLFLNFLVSLVPGLAVPLGNLSFTLGGVSINLFSPVGMVVFGTAIAIITGLAIAGSTTVLGIGANLSPFKAITMAVGLGFIGFLWSWTTSLIGSVPFILQIILVYPSLIMMAYSLVVDLGATPS
jgi:hypothetical protein